METNDIKAMKIELKNRKLCINDQSLPYPTKIELTSGSLNAPCLRVLLEIPLDEDSLHIESAAVALD